MQDARTCTEGRAGGRTTMRPMSARSASGRHSTAVRGQERLRAMAARTSAALPLAAPSSSLQT